MIWEEWNLLAAKFQNSHVDRTIRTWIHLPMAAVVELVIATGAVSTEVGVTTGTTATEVLDSGTGA